MKKILTTLLCLVLLFGASGEISNAAFGSGIAVIAEDVTMIKTGLLGEKITFSDADFKRALATHSLKSITLKSIPASSEGTLMLGGRRAGVDQTIKRKNLSSLVFIPASVNVTECKFSFTSDGILGGAEIDCILKFTEKVNYAPITKNGDESIAVWTQSGIGHHGFMTGSDPEGDACEYIVLAYPEHGVLTVEDKSTGEYRYTSGDDYEGQDSFRYVVRDLYGNYSEVETVTITVSERLTSVTYADMEDSDAYNAALVMSARGIMSGKLVGDNMLFCPQDNVTRAEFVAMAMKEAGLKADSTLTKSYFDDNEDIPVYLVGYVATAARLGIVNGSFEGTSLLFRPNDTVTALECAMILSNIHDLTLDSEEAVSLPDGIPVWATASVGAMFANGIFESGIPLNEGLTREEVAEILFRIDKLA